MKRVVVLEKMRERVEVWGWGSRLGWSSEPWLGERCWSPSHTCAFVQSRQGIHYVFVEGWERLFWPSADFFVALCTEWKEIGICFLQSKLFYFSLAQNAQDDLISEECRQIIRACTVFLLCMDSPVDPSLHGISWFCVGCCLHLQIVPQNASVLSSLCTPAPICYLLVYNKPPQNLTAGGGMIPCFNSHCLFPSHPYRKGRRVSSY